MTINGTVLRYNNMDYAYGVRMPIACENALVRGTYWRVPITGKGVHTGYHWVLVGDSVTKPTNDSVKVLHVVNDTLTARYWVAIPEGTTISVWTDLCNGCCGDEFDMPVVVIPDVIAEEDACPDEAGNRNFFSVTQALVGNQLYDAEATIDGIRLAALASSGYVSLAALETAADAAWTPNTVAVSGTKVTLTSAVAKKGSLSVTIKKYFESNAPAALTGGQKYTLAATVNGIVLPPIVGVADAALSTIATTANATPAYAAYGKWSVVANKVRLLTPTGETASLVVTIS